jgi:Predicted nucleic acid-binding protein, contains PIN domain
LTYLIDTNVLSELRRKSPNRDVVEWVSLRPASTLYLSVLTLGEIRKGVESVQQPDRRRILLDWIESDLPAFFSGRILHVDGLIADRWGRLLAEAGRPLPAIDSLLAATALQHNMALVTRNSRDFSFPELEVINPWDVS